MTAWGVTECLGETASMGECKSRSWAWLAALGIDCLQGYHFGAPQLIPHGLQG